MKTRLLALLLAGAAALSLLGVSALAAEEDGPEASAAQTREETSEGEAAPEGETPEDGAETGEEPEEEYIPDPVGALTFENLERRMRENNLTLLALEENVQAIQVIDYDEMYEDLRKALNEIASAQWTMITSIPYGFGSLMASSLDTQYDALEEQFEAIKDGELQKDNEDAIWQLQTLQDQMVLAGETTYLGVVELENSLKTVDRNLETLDRTLQELELRYELGQISSQTLEQTRASRAALVSTRQTLVSNISNYKLQLELMAGGELTGQVQLGALPRVTDQQLEEMNLEEDLAAAKEASYDLYEAGLTLDDARETYNKAGGDSHYNKESYEWQAASHQWKAAQYTYDAAVQNFETAFRTLYLQVKDCKQVLDAAGTALAVKQSDYAVAQLKQEQGSISQNELLEARDAVDEAREAADTAANDLFSAYRTYRWAVDRGILNY